MYMNRLGNEPLVFAAVGPTMSPASMDFPFTSYPISTCGEMRALKENTPNGLTPVAPDPRKFSASPVGTRTSTPKATPARSPLNNSYFPRRTTSPIPVEVPELENEPCRQAWPGAVWEHAETTAGLN